MNAFARPLLVLLALIVVRPVSAADFASVRVPVDGTKVVEDMAWSADGKSLYLLQTDGHLRRFSVPAFEVTAELKLNAKCTHLGVCSQGPVVLLSATQHIVLLSHEFEEVDRQHIPGIESLTTAATLDYVFLVAKEDIAVYDLKRKRVQPIPRTQFARAALRVKRTTPRPAAIGFRLATCTPDGQYLVAAPDHRITRFRIKRGSLSIEEQGWKIGSSGTPTSLHVGGDPAHVSLVFGSGNADVPGHPDVNYGSYVYDLTDLRVPKITIEPGAYPNAVGHDPKAGLVYGQNFEKPLVVFNFGGSKLGEFALNTNRGEGTRRFLVHPDGGRVLVLTGKALYWCTMPTKWITPATEDE